MMKRLIDTPCRAVLVWSLCLLLGTAAFAKPKKQAEPELTARGEQLEQRYQAMMDGLQQQIVNALPRVDERAKAGYLQALEDERAAKASLAEAEKQLGELGTAHALVGHARNHWIRKADRNIAAAKKKLEQAATPAQREAAQQELKKWEDDRAAGVQALEERTANYERLKQREPELRRQVEQSKQKLEQARAQVMKEVEQLGLNRVLSSDRLDARLAKYVAISDASPRGLAVYAQQGSEQQGHVDRLLADEKLLVEMVANGGAEDGRYGQAMAIYQAIQKQYPKSRDGSLQQLALAISLVHASPIKQNNPEAATNAPEFVDPVGRYAHYEKAYLDNELDPYFDQHSAWELRYVVDGDEPNETLAWGREFLRNYRPDHITTKDDRWRYVAIVRTCVRYGSEENKYDKPELQFYQNIIMNGGICGRRAFVGRFMLRAFGVPTVAKPQTGHAALGRWTPEGWVPCLGAGWNTGWAPKRDMAAIDFLALTQARETDKYMQVLRAHWIGDVMGEKRKLGFNTDRHKAEFWNSVALNTQRQIIEDAGAKTLDAVGEELGEANESKVAYPFESGEVSDTDRQVNVSRDGVITIPAAATSQPSRSTGKVIFMPSVLGGKQLHYSRNGRDQDFAYTFNAPAAGTYALTMQVVTPSWKQMLSVKANGNKPISIELPHTVGEWTTTQPVMVELKQGENTLTFSRKGVQQDVAAKGFSIHSLTLTPRR